MAERPILFSAPMVRALLDGRKTQTRRVVKLPPQRRGHWEATDLGGPGVRDRLGRPVTSSMPTLAHSATGACVGAPYEPGDRLWVRETWAPLGKNDPSGKRVVYAAGPFLWGSSDPKVGVTWPPPKNSCDAVRVARWRPSIHMPRWASRITLEVTGVRVERLRDISEEDARAEGVEANDDDGVTYYGPLGHGHFDPRIAFRSLWESINGADSWAANPWVWRIEFRRVEEVSRG